MTPLPRVTAAIRKAHAKLLKKERIRDLSYLLDVDPYGSESLVLYVEVGEGAELSASEKRALEAQLREELKGAGGYHVFFRWLSEEEQQRGSVTTKSGLIDKPVSALH